MLPFFFGGHQLEYNLVSWADKGLYFCKSDFLLYHICDRFMTVRSYIEKMKRMLWVSLRTDYKIKCFIERELITLNAATIEVKPSTFVCSQLIKKE